ncbi:MAG: DUF2752 domain-containing protein [Cyanobacteriota bacterium]|nr:DUF2752 domain-containing protein [Cyanobacteriota bacterium]
MVSLRESLSPQQRQTRIFGLAIALIPLVGSVIFNLGVHFPFLKCPLMRYVGVPCPAWGLTRSLMAVIRGDLNQAITYHLFGPLILAGFIVVALHLSLELIQNQKLNYFYVRWFQKPKFQIFGFLVFLGYHGVRLQKMWQIGELYPSFVDSPFGHFILNIISI